MKADFSLLKASVDINIKILNFKLIYGIIYIEWFSKDLIKCKKKNSYYAKNQIILPQNKGKKHCMLQNSTNVKPLTEVFS